MNSYNLIVKYLKKVLVNFPLVYKKKEQVDKIIKRIFNLKIIFNKSIRVIINAYYIFLNKKKRNHSSLAVISWSLGHNSAGRAYILADMLRNEYKVELIGCLFSQYGEDIWEPLKKAKMPIRIIKVTNTIDLIKKTIRFVKRNKYDIVYISKLRFPGLFMAVLYKLIWNSKILLDIDDYELAFFKDQKALSIDEFKNKFEKNIGKELLFPYNNIWTSLSDSLIDLADNITVPSVALQKKYGGTIIRHARDENIFQPDKFDKFLNRKKFNLSENDIVILFLGTPRKHKGLTVIADALESINNQNVVLCIVGSIADRQLQDELNNYKKARIVCFPNQPFDKIPEVVSIADIYCIFQDDKSTISKYQIPAKLTDALSMRIPVLISDVPPFDDFEDHQGLIKITENTFVDALKSLISSDQLRNEIGNEGRKLYLKEFTYLINRERIKELINTSKKQATSANHYSIIEMINNLFPEIIDQTVLDKMFNNKNIVINPFSNPDKKINIVFFWKQNDSGIYGRRQDMMVKYLMKSGRVNKILHFDAPIDVATIYLNEKNGNESEYHHGGLIAQNCKERFLKLQDENNIYRRTFIYGKGQFMGMDIPANKDDFPNYVEKCIKETGVNDNLIAWVCPVVWEFLEIQKKIQFPFIVSDVIDNQTAFSNNVEYNTKINQHYKSIISSSNVCIVNCEKMKIMAEQYIDKTILISNGAEILRNDGILENGIFLGNVMRPILGYVGNLSVRIDYKLIEKIAKERPFYSIVLIGSIHNQSSEIEKLKQYKNIHIMGVIPYKKVRDYIKSFDIAIIPHEINELTQNMDPLKLYLFLSLAIPVVSTNISVDEEVKEYISIANNNDDFLNKIDFELNNIKLNNVKKLNNKILNKISWESKIDSVFKILSDEIGSDE